MKCATQRQFNKYSAAGNKKIITLIHHNMPRMIEIFLKNIFLVFILPIACSKNNSNSNPPPPSTVDTTFTNPLLQSGPDPWVIQKDTFYYYTNTFGNHIAIYKTDEMSKLKNGVPVTIWIPPSNGAYSKDIWAPEIHYLQNKWYVYFAADNGANETHRIYVLENSSPDPTTATWIFKGKIADSSDRWAIDASEFEYNGQSYLLWSGWEASVNDKQNIYIAKLQNPWTIEGNRVMISTPAYDWEKNGAPPQINEGPEALINPSGKLFVTYSASGCWTDNYAIGLLSLKENGNPMNAADWTKSSTPVFVKQPQNGAYGPGHNGFFKSRDGRENWIIYHANSLPGEGCGDERNPRMQKFTWNADGTPNFGEPLQIDSSIRKPSGEY
jgi:GH43 family beta-xylosidase